MVDFARDMAGGDFDKTLEVHNKDEVGQVIEALNQVAICTQNIISQFNKAVYEISHGQLDYRADASTLSGGFKDLIRGANKIADTFETLINSLPVGIANFDGEFNIKYVNLAVQRMLGSSFKELMGSKCWNHLNTQICRTEECVCKKTMSSREPITKEVEANINGEIKHLDVTGLPIIGLDGNVVGATEVVYDLTEIRNIYKKLQDAINRAIDISSNLASASSELAAQVEEVSRSVDDQGSKTAEIATAMEEMNSTVLEVSKKMPSILRRTLKIQKKYD